MADREKEGDCPDNLKCPVEQLKSSDKEKEGDCSENQNQDDLIKAQQRQIEKEINESIPLVGEKEDLCVLLDEYKTDLIYQSKVHDLCKKFKHIRRTRPDGNCFFRGFGYAYMEKLIGDKAEYQRFRDFAVKSKDKLVSLGFPSFTVEDFQDTFVEALDRVGRHQEEGENARVELNQVFNDQGYSDYVVVYLRLITSGQLQQDAEFFQNFVDGSRSVVEFCHQEVEPMYKESDHIHIIALCSAIGVGVSVSYMDRGEGAEVKTHNFPEGTTPVVHLLYRPGHYDILYP